MKQKSSPTLTISKRGREIFGRVLQARREAAKKTGKNVVIPLLPKEVLIEKMTGKGKTIKFVISDEELQRIERLASEGKEITSDQIAVEVITEKWVNNKETATRQGL